MRNVRILRWVIILALGMAIWAIWIQKAHIDGMPKQLAYRLNPMQQGLVLLKQYGESDIDFESRAARVAMDIERSGHLISENTSSNQGYARIEFSSTMDELNTLEKLKTGALCLAIDLKGKSADEIDKELAAVIAKIKANGHFLVTVCTEAKRPHDLLVYYQKCKAPEWWPEAPENMP